MGAGWAGFHRPTTPGAGAGAVFTNAAAGNWSRGKYGSGGLRPLRPALRCSCRVAGPAGGQEEEVQQEQEMAVRGEATEGSTLPGSFCLLAVPVQRWSANRPFASPLAARERVRGRARALLDSGESSKP